MDAELADRLEEVRRREAFHRRLWRLRLALFAVLGAAVVAFYSLGLVKVDGHSMEPTLRDRQSLIVWKTSQYFSPPRPGDLIVFRDAKGELVKRVAFVQNAAGSVPWPKKIATVDGAVSTIALFPSEAIPGLRRGGRDPQKTIYVLGDNLDHSQDSREFGPIDPASIIGKVIYPPTPPLAQR